MIVCRGKKLHSICEVDNAMDEKAVCGITASLGYSLKPEQKVSIWKFLSGNDTFISLPTGFGKSLCYIMLPLCFIQWASSMTKPTKLDG